MLGIGDGFADLILILVQGSPRFSTTPPAVKRTLFDYLIHSLVIMDIGRQYIVDRRVNSLTTAPDSPPIDADS